MTAPMQSAPPAGGGIIVTRHDDVATVVLANPAKRNALTAAMWEALAQAFRGFATEALRAVVVRGHGAHFAAGADIGEFPRLRMTRHDAARYHAQTVGHALAAIEECPQVVVAAIEGLCVGGGLEIALACDLRLARPGSIFAIPAGRLGFPLAPSELRLVLDTVNRTTAAALLLEGAHFDAEQALAAGILTRLHADLDAELAATLDRIRAGSADAVREHKQLLRRLAADRSGDGMNLPAGLFMQAMDFAERDDYRARVAAFLARR